MLKVAVSEDLLNVEEQGIQIFGGMGYSKETPMESAWRDARIARIYEGTNEINRLMLIGQLFKKIKKKEIKIDGLVKQSYFSTIKFGSNSGKDLVKNHKNV